MQNKTKKMWIFKIGGKKMKGKQTKKNNHPKTKMTEN
jgi:hypothetical protein